MQSLEKFQTIGQVIDYSENTDCFVLIDAKDYRTLGDYYLNHSGLMVIPDEWKPAIDTERLGQFIAQGNKAHSPSTGIFCEPGTNGASMRASQCRKNTG